jgi:serine/threonine protein kinase
VKRTEIAVRGAPSTEALRLELNGRPDEEGLVLEPLHDDRQTGTLARVLGGRVGLGEVSVPVAVKLQRDMALSQEDRGSVAAKFDKERNVHRRLQDQSEGAGQERIVRQLEVWKGPADNEADSLEPCILCARARHGLTPRCPECNDPVAVLEELQLTDDRGLRCTRCNRQFWSTPKTRDAILDATVRHDPACHGCPLEHNPDPAGCRSSAVFLNFFRNRVLLLERLDLDLEDYLRWQRDEAPSGTRQAARQAFDEHRRQVREQRDRLPGPSVQKIFDLLQVVELFSDLLAGVEHLHQNGVAHLDLKLANVCVRFRGAEREVKIIDLGLSDDPHTLAYLRQAEGPLSLWTDFSAPEFRRPRSHPLALDGRFRGDACELDWPCFESASPDVPCPGDLLFFEDRDLAQQRWRVVFVQSDGGGGLRVQAEAEPRYHPWLGEARSLPPFGPEARTRKGLVVVLEKHCGFPADVYSLGMLLLAVLVGRPDVADFREALPSVQIELEDSARAPAPLPSRALVQQLLGKPSKHLQVFHGYAHRLSVYGIAQPLAEELLGMVLRATLRGDPRVFYLTDRGSDARPALRRLRADLDAVRGAVRNSLTAAQAAAVREARLAILERLRARLLRKAEDGREKTEEHVRLPSSDFRLVFPPLDLGAAGDEQCAAELAYLSPLAGQPGSVLDRWERELNAFPEASGLNPEARTGRTWDFLLRYCRVVEVTTTTAARFLDCYHGLIETVLQAGLPGDPAQAEDRERVRCWVDDHEALAERLESGPRLVAFFREFFRTFRDKLLTPWDRTLRGRQFLLFRRHTVRLPLSPAERLAIRNEEVGACLEGLADTVRKGVAVRRQRAADFECGLARWRAWCSGHSWLDALTRLEAEALRQRQELEASFDEWDQGWARAVSHLRGCLAKINTLLQPYDPLLMANPAPDEVSARLTRVQREALDLRDAEEAITWLQRSWPAPSEMVESLFALWELGLTNS